VVKPSYSFIRAERFDSADARLIASWKELAEREQQPEEREHDEDDLVDMIPARTP